MPYLKSEYLNYLAINSGIGNSDSIEDNISSLFNWQVIEDLDTKNLNEKFTYDFIVKTISNLLEERITLDELIQKGWLKSNVDINNYVSKDDAENIVNKAVDIINNKKFQASYEYEYKKDIKNGNDKLEKDDIIYDEIENKYKIITNINEDSYEYRDAQFDEVYSSFDISDSYEIDFDNAEIIPLHEEIDDTSYINNKFNLLASKNKNHVFNTNGFRVSYTINSSGLDVHVSKKLDKGTVYADGSIKSIKPSFKWTYESNDLKNCYFRLQMDTTTTLGATLGRYGNYYLKFKDLDSESFMSKMKSMIVPKADEVEATIPICQIKTPIPNIPYANINMTIGIKLYASGKIELVLYNDHNIGFEVKDGNARFFYEHNDDLDTIIKASGKAALAINCALEEANHRLCDIELDGGLKAELKSTLHLYDSDFNKTEVKSDIEYSTLEDITLENPYVKLCGDVSLYWMMDLIINTSKTVLSKMGISKTYNILNESNQVFGNLHHIEDGQFVKSCTRKSNKAITNKPIEINTQNKIVLNTSAEVLLIGETFNIEVKAIPNGYSIDDLRYDSSDNSIAKIEDGKIVPIKPGSAKVNVHTSDNKYNTYINVLVSTG